MKKILILGGNGYIGSRLIYDLQTKYNITSVDICWFGDIINNNTIIQDYKTLSVNQIENFDVVILLAGHSSVKMCDGPVVSSWNNNVNNFVNLVNKIKKEQLLIYASSGSIYGMQTDIAKEDDLIEFSPINNYDLTKYTLDNHAKNYIDNGYNIVGLRFGTVNGWSPNIREDLMINSMTKKSLLEGKIAINNLSIRRPILGITDLVYAIDAIINNPKSGIYNLASFTDTVNNIGHNVSNNIHSQILRVEDTKNVYDFDMNTEKFCRTYNFKFNETLDSIVKELVNNVDFDSFSNRNKFIDYE